MKKVVISRKLILALCIIFPLLSSTVSADCNLDAEMINQDPHPAVPGDYVEVLFQIDGTGGCDGSFVELVFDYPFSLDEDSPIRTIGQDTYAGYGHSSDWNVLYNLRVDPHALERDYEVELRYREGDFTTNLGSTVESFIISVDDGRTDFEIHFQNHVISDRSVTLEILNTGNQDIEALTVEIPKQENIVVKSSNRNIVGDLDSNEYTTADFEATPSEGEVLVKLHYTDSTGERRELSKWIEYDPSYFVDSLENTEPSKTNQYIIIALIVVGIAFFVIRRRRKKKKNSKLKFSI